LAAIELDHVLIAVTDLAEAERTFAERHGLASIVGGRHPGWGTANRIVPLGEDVESMLGRWVAGNATASGHVLGWAVRPPNLDEVAQRLGFEAVPGSRATPTGEVIRWRTVGVDHVAGGPPLPFFIERAQGAPIPGAGTAPVATVSRLDIRGSSDALSAWLGDHSLPIRVLAGSPGIASVVLASEYGPIVLGEPPGAA
jgi:hypothetical protein